MMTIFFLVRRQKQIETGYDKGKKNKLLSKMIKTCTSWIVQRKNYKSLNWCLQPWITTTHTHIKRTLTSNGTCCCFFIHSLISNLNDITTTTTTTTTKTTTTLNLIKINKAQTFTCWTLQGCERHLSNRMMMSITFIKWRMWIFFKRAFSILVFFRCCCNTD